MSGIMWLLWSVIEFLVQVFDKDDAGNIYEFNECQICKGVVFKLNDEPWAHVILTDIDTGKRKDHRPFVFLDDEIVTGEDPPP